MTDQRILERVFQIAGSGEVSNTAAVRRRLRDEGYTFAEVAAALEGQQIQGKLRAAIKAARRPG